MVIRRASEPLAAAGSTDGAAPGTPGGDRPGRSRASAVAAVGTDLHARPDASASAARGRRDTAAAVGGRGGGPVAAAAAGQVGADGGQRRPSAVPGSGWPGDPADAGTPVATDPTAVRELARVSTLGELDARVSVCRACPRLVAWREEVALTRRAAFAAEPYWGRPAPGFGPADARIAVVGLAPAAHGANRTGRVFTGDRSGDWLYAAMFRAGLANQPTSVHAGDGLELRGVRVVAAVRCAPPANKPTPVERDTCRPWLVRELQLLRPTLRAIVVLGAFGWQSLWPALQAAGLADVPTPRPTFAHGAEVQVNGLTVLGCYHVSQQNTFTGKLTEAMLDAVLDRARVVAESGSTAVGR